MHSGWTLAILLLANSGMDKPRMSAPVAVRAAENAATLLAETAARSAIVRDLIARIGASDVIVYVERTASPQIPTARTKLVTSTAAVRFLRVGINSALPPFEAEALVAHELQHVLEIAEQPDVRDDAGLRRLLQRIGHAHGEDRYETDAARQVEIRARAELRAGRKILED